MNETPKALELQPASRQAVFHLTNRLRWVVDSINERYLQQAWVSETGEVSWEDVETVSLSPDGTNTSAQGVSKEKEEVSPIK